MATVMNSQETVVKVMHVQGIQLFEPNFVDRLFQSQKWLS